MNDRTRNIFGEVRAQRAPTSLRHVPDQAECRRAEHCGGHPMCHRCATARRPSLPVSEISRHPTVSLPVQSAAQGEHPAIGIVQHAGSAKPGTPARRRSFKRWRFSDIRRRLGLPGYSEERPTRAML
jgi:hypothetical protein